MNISALYRALRTGRGGEVLSIHKAKQTERYGLVEVPSLHVTKGT